MDEQPATEPQAPSAPPMSGAETLRLWRRMLSHVRPHLKLALVLAASVVVEVLFDNLYPLGVKYLLDTAVVLHDAQRFWGLLGGLLALFVLAGVAGIVRERTSADLGARVLWDLRAQVFSHLQRLSASFYASHDTGDLLARFSSDLQAVENGYDRTLALGLYSGLGLLIGIPLLFILDWRLSLVTAVVLPTSLIGPKLLGGRASEAGYRRKQAEGQMASMSQETIGGHWVIRAFGLQQVYQKRFERQLTHVSLATSRASFLQRLIGRTNYLGVILVQMSIIGVGAYLVFADEMTVGTLVGFIGLLITVSGMTSGMVAAVPEWIAASSGMRRVYEILDEAPQVRDAPNAVPLPPFHDAIRFDHVGFSYTGERPALCDLSLCIRAGETVAFVGRSGSGKSTIFNLLTRFYEAGEGTVSVDGRDLRTVTQESLRAQMGVVFQDAFLFRGSLRDNIRLGKPDSTDEEIEDAARAAQIHSLVASWPAGYETDVGERGVRLSGGQRQRVALARAILRRPSILLLDEVTSALDPATEAAFNDTLETLSQGRNVISVTHRLRGAMNADRIFVLEDGRLLEQGTHDELLAAEGGYAQLWRQQREGLAISRDGRRAEITPERLRSIGLFAQLEDETLELLAGRFSTDRLPEQRVVFEQGDPGDKFFILAHGSVNVVRRDNGGPEVLLATLRDGDLFGEMALLADEPRSATIRTRTPCVFLTLSSHHFDQLMEAAPRLRASIEAVADERRRQTSDWPRQPA